LSSPETVVVAAVIEREGRVLICQRGHDGVHPLKWEFPGGKVDAGESPEAALERELQEELAIRASIGAEITHYRYRYDARPPILLVFYRVSDFEGEPDNRVFEQIRWEELGNLTAYDFLEGDVTFVGKLVRGEC